MYKIISQLVAFSFLLSSLIFGFDYTNINLLSPVTIETGQLSYQIKHRFLGPVADDPLDTMLGMDNGAKVQYGLEYSPYTKTSAYWSYMSEYKEHSLGLKYSLDQFMGIIPTLAVDMFSFKNLTTNKRFSNATYSTSLIKPLMNEQLIPNVTILYDGYNEKAGFGLGAEYFITEDLSVLFDYFSKHDKYKTTLNKKENSYALGLKLKTFGHRFLLTLANSTNFGPRRNIEGATSQDLTLGFEISRIFDLTDY